MYQFCLMQKCVKLTFSGQQRYLAEFLELGVHIWHACSTVLSHLSQIWLKWKRLQNLPGFDLSVRFDLTESEIHHKNSQIGSVFSMFS